MQPVIYADLRCLQDICYQRRGIGYHTSALLRSRSRSDFAHWKIIGLTDPTYPELPPDLLSVVDETSTSVNPTFNGAPSIFIDGSPMTHDTRFGLRLQNHPQMLKAAVLYDFIPLDWPGYLLTTAKRIEYLAKIARLRKFDLFFPISGYTAWRLSDLTGASGVSVEVTGACVRSSLYEAREAMPQVPAPFEQAYPYFVTIGGDDRRKNTDVAVKAVLRLNLLHGRRIPLKVIGHYGDHYKRELLKISGYSECKEFLEFYPNIPDSEVVSLHAGAIAAICPSRIEGFSLPVAEAAVCGCPVLLSTCAAQIELISQPEALFHSEDYIELATKLETLLENRDLRDRMIEEQAHLAREFHEAEVGRRFWSRIEQAVEQRSKFKGTEPRCLPRLAFLSPFPPDDSAGALYTAGVMRAGRQWFGADLFSHSQRPLVFDGEFEEAGAISVAPLLDGRYNGIVTVLGEEPGHGRILEFLNQFGGACILHDLRLTLPYLELLGRARFEAWAKQLLNRPLGKHEVESWLSGTGGPVLLLQDLIKRASPLMVQTPTQQALLEKQYGIEAHVLTCCPAVAFTEDELTGTARAITRERLRLRSDSFIVSSFGSVAQKQWPDMCVLTIELLRSWGIPADLYLVGNTAMERKGIDDLAKLYDIADHVHFGSEYAGAQAYRDFLIASDAAVQLRDYAFGQVPQSLVDTISAGLPGVATVDMARSCEAPAYIRTVGDRFSPLLIAEQLAIIWEAKENGHQHEAERKAYLEKHNFKYYAKRLMEILELG